MLLFKTLAFDEVIAGTGTWYTSAGNNDALGTADGISMFAVTTRVSGTSPTLTCSVQHSGDGRNWLELASPPGINQQTIASDGALVGGNHELFPPMLRFVRVKVTMGGTSPQCRLKLYVIGRGYQYRPLDKQPCGCS